MSWFGNILETANRAVELGLDATLGSDEAEAAAAAAAAASGGTNKELPTPSKPKQPHEQQFKTPKPVHGNTKPAPISQVRQNQVKPTGLEQNNVKTAQVDDDFFANFGLYIYIYIPENDICCNILFFF